MFSSGLSTNSTLAQFSYLIHYVTFIYLTNIILMIGLDSST